MESFIHDWRVTCYADGPGCAGPIDKRVCPNMECGEQYIACERHGCPRCTDIPDVKMSSTGRKRRLDERLPDDTSCVHGYRGGCRGEPEIRDCRDCSLQFSTCNEHNCCPGCGQSTSTKRVKLPEDTSRPGAPGTETQEDVPTHDVEDTLRELLSAREVENTTQPPPLRVGVVSWNVNHFSDEVLDDSEVLRRYRLVFGRDDLDPATLKRKGRICALAKLSGLNLDTLECEVPTRKLTNLNHAESKLKAELKRRAIPACIGRLFRDNPWLDAIALQELNPTCQCPVRHGHPGIQRAGRDRESKA